MASNSVTAKKDAARQYAAGLRALADMIETHPDLAPYLRWTGIERISVPISSDDPRPTMAAFIRAAKRHGATMGETTNRYVAVELRWGPVGLDVYAPREQVCERVVVGTETVTRQVPDPAAPLVEVTETVERVEWGCSSLLAEAVSA